MRWRALENIIGVGFRRAGLFIRNRWRPLASIESLYDTRVKEDTHPYVLWRYVLFHLQNGLLFLHPGV